MYNYDYGQGYNQGQPGGYPQAQNQNGYPTQQAAYPSYPGYPPAQGGYPAQAQQYQNQQGQNNGYAPAQGQQNFQEKTFATPADMLGSGAIMKAYSDTFVVSINPEFGIDKVRVSIVKLKTGGADHRDVYLSVDEFRQFCEEIQNGTCARKFAADNQSDFPSAYQWTKGKDGSLKLAVGMGKKGILFQIDTKGGDGKWEHRYAPVPAGNLMEMEFNFRLVSGLVPVMEGTYYGNLLNTWKEGQRKKDAQHQSKR